MENRPNAVDIPTSWSQTERSRLDFIQGLISGSSSLLRPVVNDLYTHKAAEFEAERGKEPSSSDDVSALMDDATVVRYLRFLRRKSQDMKWVGLEQWLGPCEEELDQWLEDAPGGDSGNLELNPSLEIPPYFFNGFHHQPGGFAGRPISGLMYDIGLDVSFAGAHLGVASSVPDGAYQRVLDLGCGSGRSTEPFVTRFPEAEVWGIDPSAPLLRLARVRAAQKGITINYRQATGEDTRFPDEHFDLACATILFHEVPNDAASQILEETLRVLKPGGLLVIGDLLPYAADKPFDRWYDEWQVVHNNEPFFADAKTRDLPEFCREAGFADVEERRQGQQQFFGTRGGAQGMAYVVLARK